MNKVKNYLKRIVKSILGMPDYSIWDTLPLIYYKMDAHGIEYKPNPEVGIGNLYNKLKAIEQGDSFDSPEMININQQVGKKFLSNVTKVVNIGAGCGIFEFCHANDHPDVLFVANELDKPSSDWANENRSFPNVEYVSLGFDSLIEKYGQFDMAISIDVLEHVKEYGSFLNSFSQLAPIGIITTPNRERHNSLPKIQTPPYSHHVQEFNPGELYFLLKAFYSNVDLFGINYPQPEIVPIGLYCKFPQMIAVCRR